MQVVTHIKNTNISMNNMQVTILITGQFFAVQVDHCKVFFFYCSALPRHLFSSCFFLHRLKSSFFSSREHISEQTAQYGE